MLKYMVCVVLSMQLAVGNMQGAFLPVSESLCIKELERADRKENEEAKKGSEKNSKNAEKTKEKIRGGTQSIEKTKEKSSGRTESTGKIKERSDQGIERVECTEKTKEGNREQTEGIDSRREESEKGTGQSEGIEGAERGKERSDKRTEGSEGVEGAEKAEESEKRIEGSEGIEGKGREKEGGNKRTEHGGGIKDAEKKKAGSDKSIEYSEGAESTGNTKEKSGKGAECNDETESTGEAKGEIAGDREEGERKLKEWRESFSRMQEKWEFLEVAEAGDAIFCTGRLFVEAEEDFEPYGAEEVLAYGESYILQYSTLAAIKTAYEKLREKGMGVVPDLLSEGVSPEAAEAWKTEETGESEYRAYFLERWQQLLFSEMREDVEWRSGEISEPELYNTREEYYETRDDCVSREGYFYLFVRKKEVEIEKGTWYKIEMSLPTVSSFQSQKITWKLLYLKEKKGGIANIANWSWTNKELAKKDPYALKLEQGTSWEQTRQDGNGADPVLRKVPGIPENTNGFYFKLCGKLLYDYPGYQMVLDESVPQNVDRFDIEPENMQIQRKDEALDKDEKPWTGDGYFKFATDTNNTGMTNFGATHSFHHAIFGLCLKPNRYVVKYAPNGGKGNMQDTNAVYDEEFALRRNKFKREGYTFAGWTAKADGSGTQYKDGQKGMRNLARKDGQVVTLYAQWKPKVYKATLKNQLKSPKTAGTKQIYQLYEKGWYLDAAGTKLLKNKQEGGTITIPEKEGYVFIGYYDAPSEGEKMINQEGKMTKKGIANYKRTENSVWYAHYKYLVTCQDYVDLPCDMEKPEDESREGLEVMVAYEEESKRTTVQMGQSGFTVLFEGKPKGTRIGTFVSAEKGASASGSSGSADKSVLMFSPAEGTAYQLTVIKNGKKLSNREIYFQGGRFRTLLRLGVQPKAKKKLAGESVSGSEWERKMGEYPQYRYIGCSDVEDIQSPETVCRYYVYKRTNVVYHGNGATEGKGIIECNVPLESMYQFRDNPFVRTETQTKETEEGIPYTCEVRYQFQGWRLGSAKEGAEGQGKQEGILLHPQEQKGMACFYALAQKEEAVSNILPEAMGNYQVVFFFGSSANQRQEHAQVATTEYVNLRAEWDAFPTIVQKPGNKMEFYEGEEVGKEDLIAHLAVHDMEDSRQPGTALHDKVQIRKIVYPESKNKSQKAYVKKYEEDVPEDFRLDTYFLKLEKDEKAVVKVTFAVEDSHGNTAEAEIPVMIRYNYYPEIQSKDIFYYLKEEANRGEITEELLLGYAKAEDKEDGDISGKLMLQDCDLRPLLMQTEAKKEFKVTYQVTDAYKKTSYKEIMLIIWDEEAEIQSLPQSYVRYISKEHLDTLEEHSIWREEDNYAYLQGILDNQTPAETWKFSRNDILAVQEWTTEGGPGSWKAGQGANQGFLEAFSGCRE